MKLIKNTHAYGICTLGTLLLAGTIGSLFIPTPKQATAAVSVQESLPEGFEREGGSLVDQRRTIVLDSFARTAWLINRLPVSSFQVDASGALKSFTVHGADTSMFSGEVTLSVTSVTIGADGTPLALVFASDTDTGCDMTVTIGPNGTVNYDCKATSCTEACGAKVTGEEPPYTVTCECGYTPPTP